MSIKTLELCLQSPQKDQIHLWIGAKVPQSFQQRKYVLAQVDALLLKVSQVEVRDKISSLGEWTVESNVFKEQACVQHLHKLPEDEVRKVCRDKWSLQGFLQNVLADFHVRVSVDPVVDDEEPLSEVFKRVDS